MMTPVEFARGDHCDHVWSRRCDYLQGKGTHYICCLCGHSNTYLRLRVTEEEAIQSTYKPYFKVDEIGWNGKFEAGEVIELEVSELVGKPGYLNWGRIPSEGFPPTFSCDNALFWSEDQDECWKGLVIVGEIWIDDPFFSLYENAISHFAVSHFAVFNKPRKTDDHQESTTE